MNLRETAERIIEGVPISYRDGGEEAGHERTVHWLMDLLRDQDVHEIAMLHSELAYVKFQRDKLLKITWLDLPSEPDESTAKWQEQFNKGWMRRCERGEADTKRLDWLEKLDAGLWKGITREAIDAAMKGEK